MSFFVILDNGAPIKDVGDGSSVVAFPFEWKDKNLWIPDRRQG